MHPLINRLAGDVFVMEPSALEAFLTSAAAISPEMIAKLEFGNGDPANDGEDDSEGYCLSADGTATIAVRGVLLRGDAARYRAFGIEATGYDEVFGAVTAANANYKVKRLQVVIDSPGGQAAGVHAAADVLASSVKPLSAHVETLAASGGYWLASQAKGGITAGRGAQIGSIGAYTVAMDMSKMAERAGVKVHVISSGPYKGAGVAGTALSDDQIKEMQARINKLADEFIADVARGRGASADAIRASADGRVYSTDEAIARGLVDRITSDPQKDRRMKDEFKAAAVLAKEFPGYAADVMDAVANGDTNIPALRAKIEKAEADKAAAKREAELVAVKADLAAAVAALGAEKAKVADGAAKLAEAEKSVTALKALADGAEKAGNKVASDPAPVAAVKCSKDEYAKKTPTEKAQFHQAAGVIVD